MMLKKNRNSRNDSKTKEKQKKSIIDILYTKLLKDPSTNFIIALIAFVFIVWMVIPLFLVLSGAILIPGELPTNRYFSGSLNAIQSDNNTIFYQFEVPNDTLKIRVLLETPQDADFDLSLWNDYYLRTGGRTLVENSTAIESNEETNIPKSVYSGIDKQTEKITVEGILTNGTWMVGCYAISGEGGFTITVNIKPNDPSRLSGHAIVDVFNSSRFFNFKGEEETKFFTKSTQQRGGPAVSIEVEDEIAYVAETLDGIEVLNVSNSDEITEITQYANDTCSFNDLIVQGDYLYAAAGPSGLAIFDITDKEGEFVPITFVSGISNTSDFLTIQDNYVFLDIDGKGFTIIDVTDKLNPIITARITIDTDIKEVIIKDSYAFAIGYSTGIRVYNISNPYEPQFLISYTTFSGIGNVRAQDIEIADDLAYVALTTEFAIFNISNPLSITLVEDIQNINAYGINLAENLAFITIENDVDFEYGQRIYDTSNSSNLVEVSELISAYKTTKDAYIDISSDLLYLAQGRYGTTIFDISDINNIIELDDYEDSKTLNVIIISGKNRGVVLNTLILGVSTTIFSIIIGTALAFILARYEFPGKKVVSLLALAPLIIPPFISGMGFRLILGQSGLINILFLEPLFNTNLIFTGFAAICYVQTSHFYALVYLNAFSSFLNIDPSMEESAENLGAGSFRLFRTITLPLAMPGIGAGSILVLILSMEDVGTPIIFAGMGDNEAKQYLTYFVFENYSRAGSAVINPEVCVLGGILLVIAIIGFFIIRKYVSLRKYAMISKGRAGEYRMSKAGWKLLFIYPFLIVLFALSLLVHIGVILMSLLEELGPTKAADLKFTFQNYVFIFDASSAKGQIYNIPPYVMNTLVYSVIATMLIIILGSLAAYVISRKDFKGKNIMDALVTLPIAIPGIVLAIGYYRTFDWSGIASRNPTFLNNLMAKITANLRLDPFIGVAVTLLILSYTVRKFPFTVRSAFAGLQQTDVALEEASFNLGASRMQTFRKVTIPLISLNIFAGSLVSFLYCLSEVSTTIFLIFASSAGTLTWYMAWNPLAFQIFCALGVLLMVLQILSLFVTNVILGSRAEAITGI